MPIWTQQWELEATLLEAGFPELGALSVPLSPGTVLESQAGLIISCPRQPVLDVPSPGSSQCVWKSVGRLVALWLGVVVHHPPKISQLLLFVGVRGSASLAHGGALRGRSGLKLHFELGIQ